MAGSYKAISMSTRIIFNDPFVYNITTICVLASNVVIHNTTFLSLFVAPSLTLLFIECDGKSTKSSVNVKKLSTFIEPHDKIINFALLRVANSEAPETYTTAAALYLLTQVVTSCGHQKQIKSLYR